MQKNLIEFSLEQLLQCNLHIGLKKNYWNSLSHLFIIGYRLDNYILNINLAIINLKKSLILIEIYSFKQKQLFFFLENKLFITNLFRYSKYFFFFNINFLLINYLSGIITNFKNFRLNIYPRIKNFIRILSISKSLKYFFLKKKYFRLLGLANYNSLPVISLSLTNNNYLCNEMQKLNLPSIQIMDAYTQEQSLNKITYIIPFNLSDSRSIILFFNLFLKSIIIGFLRTKKLFLKLINFSLKYFKEKFVLTNLKQLMKINFSFIVNFYKHLKNKVKITDKNIKKNILIKKYFLLKYFRK